MNMICSEVQKRVYYECPECGSKKKPKVVKYYPLVVGCKDCYTEGKEAEFIREEGPHLTPIQHYYH